MGGASLPSGQAHAFVYFITIRNGSERVITLLGRKWVIDHVDGTRLVVEGDKIVGETPRLAPGEQFSYNSYHVTGCDAGACGSFHGVRRNGPESARDPGALSTCPSPQTDAPNGCPYRPGSQGATPDMPETSAKMSLVARESREPTDRWKTIRPFRFPRD